MVGAKWGPSGGILPARELLLVSQEISPGEGARVPAGPHIRGAAKERDTDRHTGPSVCCLTIIGPLFLGTYTEIERSLRDWGQAIKGLLHAWNYRYC